MTERPLGGCIGCAVGLLVVFVAAALAGIGLATLLAQPWRALP